VGLASNICSGDPTIHRAHTIFARHQLYVQRFVYYLQFDKLCYTLSRKFTLKMTPPEPHWGTSPRPSAVADLGDGHGAAAPWLGKWAPLGPLE